MRPGPIGKVSAFLLGTVIGLAIIVGLWMAGDAPRRAPEQLPGMFETTGGGAVTVGCSLWDVPQKGQSYDGDAHDFAVQSDRDNFIMIVVHEGTSYILSGEQCGYSIDWRRFPTTERKPDGNLRAESPK